MEVWTHPAFLANIFSFTQSALSQFSSLEIKETTLESADFTIQLLMFVTAEKEERMFIISIISISSVFVSCCPRNFKLG